MARAVYQYELSDPDFSWLLSSFQENHPEYRSIESGSLPVTFIRCEHLAIAESAPSFQPMEASVPSLADEDDDILNLLKGTGKE